MAVFCALIVLVLVYFFCGFALCGIASPYAYDGADSTLWYLSAKTMQESGWFLENARVGAPGSYCAYDFPSTFLMNIDNVFEALLIHMTNNFFTAYNILILISCSLSAFISYLVLRELKLQRYFSFMGGLLYGTTPYILFRSEEHINLTTAFFIPLSVLLCVWCYQKRDNFLQINKNLFKTRENWLALIFAFLLSNNGLGYYQFFTCFFLCVVALIVLIEDKSFKSILCEIKLCILIVVFSAVNLIPVLIFQRTNGSNMQLTSRGVGESDEYALKIAQMFIPSNSTHGLKFLGDFIHTYNTEIPLVNENQAAYLGLIGIIGFLMSIYYLLKGKQKDDSSCLMLFSKLIMIGILFANIGGFSSLFSMFVHFIRSYNRISIFIVFMSLYIALYTFQKLPEKEYKKEINKRIVIDGTIILLAFCLFEQLPNWAQNYSRIRNNTDAYISDSEFIQSIENELNPNDMVYQLPYHKFPEGGHYDDFNDYMLFTGYLWSDTLRWSYGSSFGREVDTWNQQTASLGTEEMIDTIIQNGFTGLYIDSRGYTEIDLIDVVSHARTVVGVVIIAEYVQMIASADSDL